MLADVAMVSHYQSVEDDWEACLTQTFYTVPITSYISLQQSKSQACAFDQFLTVPDTTCTFDKIDCVQQLQANCLSGAAIDVCLPVLTCEMSVLSLLWFSSQNNVRIPVGQLLQALSYNGIQTTIFSLAAHGNYTVCSASLYPIWSSVI